MLRHQDRITSTWSILSSPDSQPFDTPPPAALRMLTAGVSKPRPELVEGGRNVEGILSGTNLFTMTDFLSYSPEQDLSAGVFPETLNMTVGLKLSF